MDFAASVLQSVSGLTFSAFTLLHLGGHFLSPISFHWADTAMFASRELYQSPAIELWIIGGSLFLHVSSSVTRYLLRKNKTNPVGAIQWHRYAGYATTLFLIPHVIGARLSPLLYSPEIVDLTLITHFLNHHAVMPKVMTYTSYIIGTGCAMFHALYGIQKALSVCFKTKPYSLFSASSFKTVLFGCLMMSALTVLSIGGMFETIDSSSFRIWTDMEMELLNLPSQLLIG